jgi:DNA mismatch repair ATPase MutS
MNRTRSKPGERTLRGWFSRPTQDLATLRERHGFIACLSSAQHAQLLPALHEAVGKMKDITSAIVTTRARAHRPHLRRQRAGASCGAHLAVARARLAPSLANCVRRVRAETNAAGARCEPCAQSSRRRSLVGGCCSLTSTE